MQLDLIQSTNRATLVPGSLLRLTDPLLKTYLTNPNKRYVSHFLLFGLARVYCIKNPYRISFKCINKQILQYRYRTFKYKFAHS